MDKTKISNGILPDGASIQPNSKSQTKRSLERDQEDKDYLSVIIKRTDEAVQHPDDVLKNVILEGLEQIRRPSLSLGLSSFAAGLILGFTAMAVAVISQLFLPIEQPLLSRVATAFVYPFGFIICIMAGTQLFTEHTATAVYPILEKKASIRDLLRLWAIVIFGNLLGTIVSAGLLTSADDVIHAKNGYIIIALHLTGYSSTSIFISSILAGILMAHGAWLVTATPTISKIVCIYIVTFLIGIGGLHHSIAGSAEMFVAYFISNDYTLLQTLKFIGLALFGNLTGGSLFVAFLNYSHIRKTQIAS